MRRGWIIIGTMLVAALGLEALAEVRSTPGRRGTSERGMQTSVESGRPADVWRPMSGNSRGAALNPRGAQMGDLFPTVAESSISPYTPWVIWSRHNGVDFDLVWSRWRQDRWEPIRPLDPAPTLNQRPPPPSAHASTSTACSNWGSTSPTAVWEFASSA